jgi:hypothetical protein
MVSRVFATLERDAYLEGLPRGPKRARDPEGLLEAWAKAPASDDPEFRGISIEPVPRILERLSELPESGYALTGESAATLIAPFTRVPIVDIYVNPGLNDHSALIEKLNIHETSRGANVVLVLPRDAGVFDGAEEISSEYGRVNVVARPQLYVDLRHRGGAADEAAQYLKERGAIWLSE